MRAARVLLLLVVGIGSATVLAVDLEDARSHKNHGRYEESVAAYRLALESDPEYVTTLRELAQVLSWMGNYQEAIDFYQKALAQDPSDDEATLGLARTYSWATEHARSLESYDAYLERHPEEQAIRLERAKVQSWSGNHAAAIEFYEAHLVENPEDQKTRLELAKVLSWSGRLEPSIRAYRDVLDAEPENLEAQIGLARTLSWSGELGEADQRYDAILSAHPGDTGARLGKAQLALWRGETREGYRLLDEMEAASPGNPEIERYRKELRQYQRPVFESSSDRVQDSDGNDYRVHRVSLTTHLTPFTTLAGILRRSETTLQGQEASVDFVGARLGLSLPRHVQLQVTAGVDFVNPSVGDSTSRLTGTVAAFGPITGTWRWNAVASHRTFDSVREVVDNGITMDSLHGGVDGRIKNWRVGGGGGLTDFSDDNQRLHVTGYARYPWELPAGISLEAGYRFRWMSYDDNLDSGYFDPQSFYSNVATLLVRGPLGTPRADWSVRLEGGVQSFTIDPNGSIAGEKQSSDEVFAWQVRIGVDIQHPLRLEAYYGETDYALQSATGFESEQWGVLLRYRF